VEAAHRWYSTVVAVGPDRALGSIRPALYLAVVIATLAVLGVLWIVFHSIAGEEAVVPAEPLQPASQHDEYTVIAPVELERSREAETEPAIVSEVPPSIPPDPEMAPWGPWRKMRLDEVDRALAEVRTGTDLTQRQLELQFFLIVCISPLADEMGLSEPSATADKSHPRSPLEYAFSSNRNYYRIPQGTFPLLDDFMRIWDERNLRRAKLSQAEEAHFDETDPFPLEAFVMRDLEALAERARAALRRRAEAY